MSEVVDRLWRSMNSSVSRFNAAVVWLLCHLLITRVRFEECMGRSCVRNKKAYVLPCSGATHPAELLSQAHRTFEAMKERGGDLRDKGKVLVTLLLFQASFLTLAIKLGKWHEEFWVPTLLTFITVVLTFELFGLYWSAFPKMGSELLEESTKTHQAVLAEDYLRAARFGECCNDYCATVLQGARRAAMLAMLAGVWSVVSTESFGNNVADAYVQVEKAPCDEAVDRELRRSSARLTRQAVLTARAIHSIATQTGLLQNEGGCPTIGELLDGTQLDVELAHSDPWGSEYSLICVGNGAIVRSAGPDRFLNTQDDILVPEIVHWSTFGSALEEQDFALTK